MTDVLYLICPMCGKTSPLYAEKTTLKALDEISDLALISTRRSYGRAGFKSIGDPVPLSSRLSDPVCLRLANEAMDISSGLLTIFWENELPLEKPSLLRKLERLAENDRAMDENEDGARLKADDYARQVEELTEENKSLWKWRDDHSPLLDDYRRTNKQLRQKVEDLVRSGEGEGFGMDDVRRENNRLIEENKKLHEQIVSLTRKLGIANMHLNEYESRSLE